MDDKTIRKKLRQFVALGNELDEEAKRRYGQEGLLFHEGDGSVVILNRLPDDGSATEHVLFVENGAQWGAGAF